MALKFTDTLITFTEVPDEVSLCINISNCPCRCQACFEPWLQEDIGEVLTDEKFAQLLEQNSSVTCICFMGGDAEPDEIISLITNYEDSHDSHFKWAMYSGQPGDYMPLWDILDYYKIGPYVPAFGPLNLPTTNQRMFKKDNDEWIDITYKFQEKKV